MSVIGDDDVYGAATYGDRIAEVYDSFYGAVAGTDDVVRRLEELAERGSVLELGIGTGRIALPLQERGVPVFGIDSSLAMIEKLRAKPGGGRLPVVIGDFADVAVEGDYALVFVVFNTFFALLTQEDQVRCFANVAKHLRPGGRFVVQAFVPAPGRFEEAQRLDAIHVGNSDVILEASRHDAVGQRVTTQQIVLAAGGVRLYPVQIRYAWPSELDLMARLAGLELESRHGGWNREPFSARSAQHVSVWRRP